MTTDNKKALMTLEEFELAASQLANDALLKLVPLFDGLHLALTSAAIDRLHYFFTQKLQELVDKDPELKEKLKHVQDSHDHNVN